MPSVHPRAIGPHPQQYKFPATLHLERNACDHVIEHVTAISDFSITSSGNADFRASVGGGKHNRQKDAITDAKGCVPINITLVLYGTFIVG
jgi:hypothetical protein